MQHKANEYKPVKHDKFKALTVKQPWADKIMTGQKKIEVRNYATSYRGDLVITSSKTGNFARKGVTLCRVKLYQCRPFNELNEEERYQTAIPRNKWKYFRGTWAWKLKDSRPVSQIPVKGGQRIWNLVLDRGELQEYNPDKREVYYSDKFIKNMVVYGWTAIVLMVLIVAYIIYKLVT